ALKDLKLDFLQKKERFETLHSFSDMKELLPSLQRHMAWSLVRDKEQFVQRLKEDVEKEESNQKHQENLKLCQTKLTAAEQKLRGVRSRIESVTQEQEALSEGHLRLKEQLKVVSKEHNEQEIVYFRALNKFKESEREQNFLQEKINKTRTSLSVSKDGETEYSKQQKRIVSLRKQLEELEETHSQLKRGNKERASGAVHRKRGARQTQVRQFCFNNV
ncbi:structural maintenance of chromosomes protein 6-like, partial [Notothenia coriiceps]|uniref:Structural maintenance of chromosomes protein 6-like n=1 Tax=Notothenia coriiceps TaxID=8208 RepID=A0A6I9Q7Q4_9TELE